MWNDGCKSVKGLVTNPSGTAPWCPGEPNDSGGGARSGDCVRIIGNSA